MEKERKAITTTINRNLYKELQILAVQLNKNNNDLLEEGIKLVIEKYKSENNTSAN